MKVSKLLDDVLNYAGKYEKHNMHGSGKEHSMDAIFLGMMKSADENHATDKEAKQLYEAFRSDFSVEPYELRFRLKKSMAEVITEEDKKNYVAVKNELSDKDKIDTMDMYQAIMKHPSRTILSLLPEKKVKSEARARKENGHEKIEAAPKKESERNIEDLVLQLRMVRDSLLEKIFGQNHAINSFIDGYWNAEMASMTHDEKQSVKGLFVFAGPPGVGKTFLAEEAAKEMGLPCKRFDMSGYSYHDSVCDLTGFSSTYQGAKRGLLTDFVAKNEKCVLIFDEIEKAHKDVIMLFLQILDGGTLQELYDGSLISFKNAILIFTTNVGRDLYEYGDFSDASSVSKQQVIDALRQDINPETKQPYFPAAICSRLSTGNVVMFNNLSIHDLEQVCRSQFNKVAEQIDTTFGISLEMDEKTLSLLIFEEGNTIDARNMSNKIVRFVRAEFKKFVDLFATDSIRETISSIGKIVFRTELEEASEEIKKLFVMEEKQNMLLVGANMLNNLTFSKLKNYNIILADMDEEIEEAFNNSKIDFVLLQLDSDIELPEELEKGNDNTRIGFDFTPVTASDLGKRRKQIIDIRRNHPETVVYILKTEDMQIDRELALALSQDGVKGFVDHPTSKSSISRFVDNIDKISQENYLQNQAKKLMKANKVLTFETAPKFDVESNTVIVRLKNLAFRQEISVLDQGDINVDTENIRTRFNDVIGANEAKKELQYFVEYLLDPNKFISRKISAPKGVLLYGAPGTGKTMLARAMAGEAKVTFIGVEGSSFINKYQGSGAAAVRKIFAKARKYAPSIIFIDEIDAIGKQRTGSDNSLGAESALNALLAEMDGIRTDPKKVVFVLAATNYKVKKDEDGIGRIDTALIRRFDKMIRVDLPDKDSRRTFLQLKLKESSNQVSNIQIEQIVDRSVGMSLANLDKILESAKRDAMSKKVDLKDDILNEAFESYVHGTEKKWNKAYLEKIARHEAGHVILNYLAGFKPSYVTIVARGTHGGYTQYALEDKIMLNRNELLAQIRGCLGGRAAELIYYGENGLTTSAAEDLKQATAIAKAIVSKYGMDEDMGLFAFSEEDLKNPYFAEKLYTKVNEILLSELENAKQNLEKYKNAIDIMVDRLLTKNQLNAMEIEDIIFDADLHENNNNQERDDS